MLKGNKPHGMYMYSCIYTIVRVRAFCDVLARARSGLSRLGVGRGQRYAVLHGIGGESAGPGSDKLLARAHCPVRASDMWPRDSVIASLRRAGAVV